MRYQLSQEQIKHYKEDGVILIKEAFFPWIEKLKIGFDKVLKNPGPHARENVTEKDNRKT